MELYFFRHGMPVDPKTWHGSDEERPLADEGRRVVLGVAKTLHAFLAPPGRILTSPLNRARQTAALLASELDVLDRLEADSRLSPGFSLDALARMLADRSTAKSLVLVGHEPDFSRVIGELIGGGRVECGKASVACVSIEEPGVGTLRWLLQPAMLVRLPESLTDSLVGRAELRKRHDVFRGPLTR